jgi:hypothetical protein
MMVVDGRVMSDDGFDLRPRNKSFSKENESAGDRCRRPSVRPGFSRRRAGHLIP